MDPNNTKLTGLNSINSTLSRGSFGDQVKALQQYLIGLGYTNVKADGVYGPQTELAVKQYQLDNGLKGDGTWGPISQQKAVVIGGSPDPAGAPGTGKAPDDASYMFNTETGALNDKFVPKTQEELDKYYNTYVASHPVFAGNNPEALAYAAETGDFGGLYDAQGKPFSNDLVDEALGRARKDLAPRFREEKSYDDAGIRTDLESANRDFNRFLDTEKENFQEDKTTLDQNAADRGVLFSGGRYEKEKKLANDYARNEAYQREKTAAGIADLARGYQYTYGNKAAANPSLSQYYQLGGNTYNANVARNGVGSSPLSKIYNTGNYDFTGTKVRANELGATSRATKLLANRGNKLLSTGYNNQF